jgi:hypothetical protein
MPTDIQGFDLGPKKFQNISCLCTIKLNCSLVVLPMTASVPVCDIHVFVAGPQAFFPIAYGDMGQPSSCPPLFGIHAYVTGPRSGDW